MRPITRTFPPIYLVLLVTGVLFLPVMTALLFNAGAEAFFGTKEPMFETILGLTVGGLLASGLGVGGAMLLATGRKRPLTALLIVVLTYDILAIPLARWLGYQL
jgi:hypothetical protein